MLYASRSETDFTGFLGYSSTTRPGTYWFTYPVTVADLRMVFMGCSPGTRTSQLILKL